MKSLNQIIIILFLLSLAVLMGIELGVNYDILDRRVALSTTAMISGVSFIIIDRVLKRKYQIVLSWYVALSVVIGVWLDAMGNFFYFYSRYGWWDDFTHFVGSLSVAITLLYIFFHLNKKGFIKLGRFNLNLFVVSVTMLLVSFYEISEYLGDLLFSTRRIGERFDTASDLTSNLLGALAVVLVGAVITRKKKTTVS
ncbi:MAG: hypothetical protein COY66_04240 [Candidatus Kerfeldbacteria bacterium CG_4_10_14_0_8_um_filter_42_10]|uniref:DUF2238 domain-containing protein n=1 Tax=Candidatus Kerfeldbacteria bacterium CG_4_10_14_0_8_um_filter_42_10 TaxID=2014248 RepID=A0A2M7RHV0_9BACT|nr:MAG: hypothetical protein COY66_04240 [Candidatus Kerfeldbacteria bacterium CG_4_10_14_0_8_um_filter_42_10]